MQVVSPELWTPTARAKAKAIAGFALGLWFRHSFGRLHGHLTANNALFNQNGEIQITEFCLSHLAE
jgi:hypothetical protein